MTGIAPPNHVLELAAKIAIGSASPRDALTRRSSSPAVERLAVNKEMRQLAIKDNAD